MNEDEYKEFMSIIKALGLETLGISDHYINKLSSKDYIQFIIKPNNAITAEKSIQLGGLF